MAAVTLDIEKMTVEEKLAAMELLWDSLRQNEEDIPIPDWHKELLDEREREIEAGEVKFEDWETAKAGLSKMTSVELPANPVDTGRHEHKADRSGFARETS